MTQFLLINADNQRVLREYYDLPFNLIYADMIYENLDFSWVDLCYPNLAYNGISVVQTDYHTVAEMKIYLDKLFGKDNFVNWCIYVNDWGGTPKKGFPRKHDDILIYAKNNDWKWNKLAIEIPKKTAGTAFDKKGTGLKTPCDVFYDKVSFSTIAKERVKSEDNHNLQWQKPIWLMERLITPFTDEGDKILDLFMGSGTLAEWCIHNNRNYVGIENDPTIFNLAVDRVAIRTRATAVDLNDKYVLFES